MSTIRTSTAPARPARSASLGPIVTGLALLAGLCAAGSGCGGEIYVDDDADRMAQRGCRGAPYPIILAHGMAGFERIGPLDYFFRVAEDLRGRGEIVVQSEVAPYDLSETRARQLAAFVDRTLAETRACRVNIIAHSQGGLDARYLVSSLGYGARVASITTISTPHRGSPLGDIAGGLIPGFAESTINTILRAVQGLSSDAPTPPNVRRSLAQVSIDYTTRVFNPRNPDDPRVRYYSVAGRSGARRGDGVCAGGLWPNPSRVDLTDPLLALPESIIALRTGLLSPTVNDGLVAVESARWGKFLGCVPADHFDEIGQIAHLVRDPISGFEHRELYRKLAAQLHADGL